MGSPPELIESTAGKVAEELARRGIAPDQRVMITIEPDDWLDQVRRFARPRVMKAYLNIIRDQNTSGPARPC